MKLPVLGGTRLLGRHVVAQALDAGHRVTLLHRGRSNARCSRRRTIEVIDGDTQCGLKALCERALLDRARAAGLAAAREAALLAQHQSL